MTSESSATVTFGAPIPYLRIFDISKAREFFIDYLGFETLVEHRFEPDTPLFWIVRRGALRLFLTEHHGDASPGGHCNVPTAGVAALHAELTAKNYRYLRPGLERTEWNTLEFTVIDPFANRITFAEMAEA